MSSTIEQIKNRLNIVDIVGSYLKLEKSGSNFKAKCPFHNEKTPSFYVSPDRDSYHCFGCGKGGDIISFVQEMEGVEFIEALKILADKAGVKLDKEKTSEKSESEKIRSILKFAIDFYRKELVKNEEVVKYLKNRGLNKETILKFEIGFAPCEWRLLYEYLKKNGFTDKEIESSGLSIRSQNGFYDRFRNRIMFPIFNISGMPVGFSGRMFESGKKEDLIQAKYINSPQTLLYDKSRILYGIEKAKLEIKKKNECILVEGQFDLIMSHQAGTFNTVAVSGTSLTEKHLEMIQRFSENIIMAFDGDSAGIKASSRAINMALSLGIKVKLVSLRDGLDPADIIRESEDDWRNIVSKSKHIVDFFIDVINSRKLTRDEKLKELETTVLLYISNIKSKIEQAEFVNKISESFNIQESAIWEEIDKIIKNQGESTHQKIENLFSQNTAQGKMFELIKRSWSFIEWQRDIKSNEIDPDIEELRLEKIIGKEKYDTIKKELKKRSEQLIMETEISFEGSKNQQKEIDDLLNGVEEEFLRKKREEACLMIKKNEKAGDFDKMKQYLKEFDEFSRKLDNLKHNFKNENQTK